MKEARHGSGVAIVTGAAGGIGSKCAELLAENGWQELILCGRDNPSLQMIAELLRANGSKISTLGADITDLQFPARLLEGLGAREISAFVHVAGVSHLAERDQIFEINLDASLRLLEAVKPRMAEYGAAVLFASLAGHLPVSAQADAAFDRPIPAQGSASLRHFASNSQEAYFLSKRAIIATVKREAKAFGERKARIVSVSPGLIDTVMTQGAQNEIGARLVAGAAVPRLGRPEEVAEACVFLCSSAASFITGSDLKVDGGQFAGLGI